MRMKGCYLQEPPSVDNTKGALEVGYCILNNNKTKSSVLRSYASLAAQWLRWIQSCSPPQCVRFKYFHYHHSPRFVLFVFCWGRRGMGVLHQEILSGVYACSSANNNGELENRHFHFQTKSRIDGRMDACKFIASSSASLRRCFPSPPH